MNRDKLLWLDDVRFPPHNRWIWVKTAPEAIELLKTKTIQFASLDHDLLPEHYQWAIGFDYIKARLTSGWAVTNWLMHEVFSLDGDLSVLPPGGVRVHSMNAFGAKKMYDHIKSAYEGDTFQCVDAYEVLPWELYGQPPGWWKTNTTGSMIARYNNARHYA